MVIQIVRVWDYHYLTINYINGEKAEVIHESRHATMEDAQVSLAQWMMGDVEEREIFLQRYNDSLTA